MGSPAEHRALVRRQIRARPHALRQRGRSLPRATVSRRATRLNSTDQVMDATVETAGIAVRSVRWQPCLRIIATRFPTIHLYERVADAADWDALYALESLTNPRLQAELGAIDKIPREDRTFGPGASVIMAPFIYLNPDGGRFTDATFGAFYAANSLATAIAETDRK